MRDLTPERLTRLLAMITYFADGRQVPFAEAAEHFGITEAQLLDDINTLWVSGAPGYTHAELIDFEADAFENGLVSLQETQQMDRALRLSPGEAISLLVAVNSLIARLGESELLISTKEKLQQAAGQAAAAAERIHIDRTEEATQRVREDLHDALTRRVQVRLEYVSGTDSRSIRTVDPLHVEAVGEHWMLRAWCHRAQGLRNFRLDRILALEVLATPVVVTDPGEIEAPDLDTSTFPHRVRLRLAPRARWVVEQIPVENVQEHNGAFTVEIAAGQTSWLEQLCLRLGEAVLAIDPPEMADRVRTAARAALAQYAGEGGAGT